MSSLSGDGKCRNKIAFNWCIIGILAWRRVCDPIDQNETTVESSELNIFSLSGQYNLDPN